MKKLMLGIASLVSVGLLLVGAWLLLWDSGSKETGDQPARLASVRPVSSSPLSRIQDRAPGEAGQVPSFEELKTRVEAMSDDEVERELAQVSAVLEQENYIERANNDELTAAERLDLAALLRQKNALGVVKALRLVDSMDAEDDEL